MGLLAGEGAYHAERQGTGGRDMCVLIDRSTSTNILSASSSRFTATSSIGVSSVFSEGGVGNKEGSGDERRGLVVIRGFGDQFGWHVGFVTASLYDGLERAIAN